MATLVSFSGETAFNINFHIENHCVETVTLLFGWVRGFVILSKT